MLVVTTHIYMYTYFHLLLPPFKFEEDTYASEEEAERVKQRLAKARALDKEKYGE